MSNRTFIVYLFLILLAGVLFRIWNFTPELGNDDQRWVITAQEFRESPSSGLHSVYYGRILWRLLLMTWGKVAGLTLATTPFLMFALSCVTAALIAFAARLAFNEIVGLWAAAFYSTHPLTIVYDVLTLPDGLAVALLAGSIYFFARNLSDKRYLSICLCGLLVGLSFSAKTYFILIALPIGACILFGPGELRKRLRVLCAFSAFVAVGLSVDLLLHYWESGEPLRHFTGVSDYGERILAREDGETPDGVQRLARILTERFRYLKWLFADMGIVTGFLSLVGVFTLFFESKRNLYCLVLSLAIATFIVFLLFCPANIVPFAFVEMQPRYLGIVLPMISMGAGVAVVAALNGLPPGAARRGLLAGLVCGIATNVAIPNDLNDVTFNRSIRLQFDGIRYILKHAEEKGISEFVLPDVRYKTITPDSFAELGPNITYYDARDTDSAEKIRNRVISDPSVVVFVPRNGFNWPLVHMLRRGQYHVQLESDKSYEQLTNYLKSNGTTGDKVLVPDTVLMAWLSRAGLVSREQQLIGWIYRRAAAHAPATEGE